MPSVEIDSVHGREMDDILGLMNTSLMRWTPTERAVFFLKLIKRFSPQQYTHLLKGDKEEPK